MFIGGGSSSGVDVGDIQNSLRFRSAASAYLSRTPGSAGNRKTWTLSLWGKVGDISTDLQRLLSAGADANNRTEIILSANKIRFFSIVASVNRGQVDSTAVFRDPTAHGHLVIALDATNTAVNFYWNNLTLDKTVTTAIANVDHIINATVAHSIGRYFGTGNHFDGYLSRVCFVDGTALTPSSFGYLNTEINEWVSKSQSACKAVVDAGGTNSFMLDFDDATSLTTLGNDKSAKNNDWTLTNFSLTAGVTYDHMLDVPGNSFATLNPLVTGSYTTLSNGNLTSTGNSGTDNGNCRVSIPVNASNPLVYLEFTPSTMLSSSYPQLGIIDAREGNSPTNGIGKQAGYNSLTYPGNSVIYLPTGQKQTAGSGSAYGNSFVANDVISMAVDYTNGAVYFRKNGTWQNSGDPTSGASRTGAALTWTGGTVEHLISISDYNGSSGSFNFGQRPFAYTPPTGFKALCQANLPTPAILNPKKHFDVVTRASNGSSNYTKTGLGFQPDLVWTKERSPNAYDHVLWDAVRGTTKWLASNSTAAEATASQLAAFTSDGYTINYGMGQANYSTDTYVDWLWKAGGAGVSNTAGSITSTVSANVEAGFSIVTYTGTGANATVGHGLGVAPKMVIVKNRTGAANHWPVYHSGLTSAAYALRLNLTNAQASAAWWNSTAPTSSVFSLGAETESNTNTNTYVAYCFAEIPGYSKIGSYVGNNSTDGPFVYCGFRPRWIMMKSISTGGSATYAWSIFDSARSSYNIQRSQLEANTADAEDVTAVADVDILSNGFKPRYSPNETNGANTYIFMAFADVPAKFSNAR